MDCTALKKQHIPEHLVLAYSDEQKRDDMIIEYIKTGLEHGQLCVIATTRSDDFDIKLSKKIKDFNDHIISDNIIYLDLNEYKDDVRKRDTTRFDLFVDYLKYKSNFRKDKHIRFYGDLAGAMFNEGDFEICIAVEQWCHQKLFFGSLICPHNLGTFTEKQKEKLISLHDDVVYCTN